MASVVTVLVGETLDEAEATGDEAVLVDLADATQLDALATEELALAADDDALAADDDALAADEDALAVDEEILGEALGYDAMMLLEAEPELELPPEPASVQSVLYVPRGATA